MKKWIALVIVGVMVVIIMSNMSYEQQTIIPALKDLLKDKPFEEWLSQFEIPYWGKIISVETRGYFQFLEFLIRKATHFFGYGLLAVIVYILYRKLKWRFAVLLAFITTILIASLDEYRQSTIPGRSGLVEDVVLDACGALTLLVLAKLILVVFKKVGRT